MANSNEDDLPRETERKFDWLMLLLGAVVMFLVWHFSTREKGVATAGTVILIYAETTLMWRHHKEKWLWLVLAIFAALHLAAVWLIPFRLPSGPALPWVLPLAMFDGFLMWWVLRWLASKLSPMNRSR